MAADNKRTRTRTAERVRRLGKVALLLGGDSPEREVSLMSGAQVGEALARLGVDFVSLDPAKRPLSALPRLGVRRALNILHGGAGENGTVPAALAMLGIACSGSGALGSALAMDKFRAKLIWEALGVPTPPSAAAGDLRAARAAYRAIGPSVFVKPVSGGSSIGVAPAEKMSELTAAASAIFEKGGTALVEKRIRGDELNLAILQDRPLPLVRVEAAGEFYDYEAFHALGCSGWGRVEFILDRKGNPHFLEANTVPGMTSHSLVPMAAKQAGVGFDELVLQIVEDAV